MSAYLYRLYAVQTFNQRKVGVYVHEGNFPDSQILSDGSDIVEGVRTRKEILEHNDWFYGLKEVYPNTGRLNRERLTYYTRILKRSKKVIDDASQVNYAIIVGSTSKKEWRGDHTLYKINQLDDVKCDTPEFAGWVEEGTIKV